MREGFRYYRDHRSMPRRADGPARTAEVLTCGMASTDTRLRFVSHHLALHIIAAEKQTSIEYLRKLCRKWEPALSQKPAEES